jgi:sterol desaturase/sphingolipid hydroxylase (fatty acid hydroxylase superfamily)
LAAAIPYRVLLGILAGIFALRVAAQFFLQDQTVSLLPPFDLWHSATMSYGALLGLQLLILGAMGAAIKAVPLKRARPTFGALLIALGWIYVGAMTVRLAVGALNLSQHSWFEGAVSTAFHFLLAAFVLILGSALKAGPRDQGTPAERTAVRYMAYPALMIGGLALFNWLLEAGAPLLFSSYLAVLVAGFGVLMHETFFPARQDWRPQSSDVLNDSLFLSIVQILLPTILKALALALIVMLARSERAPFASLWPHGAPVILQVLGMLFIAEFFRYWLHRALHEIIPLWRFHAVHHASDKLYTVNVGRFHPLDKSLQFLGDTLPFLLLGVSPEVFATYFVLYAINGFYQHSNADVRLGPLNWVIAGPELHRWHHSAELSEANSNYGNNLIVWDAIFGTRFLPKDREVGRIGIGNPAWPNTFLAQMAAPFTTSTDAPSKD